MKRTPWYHRIRLKSASIWYIVYLLLPIEICWITVILAFDYWAVVADNAFMAVTMMIGSFIAGATSEGGGAVAFPVMTLLFEIPPAVARNFSLCIQSVGMTVAGITIIKNKTRVEWKGIRYGALGGITGICVGAIGVAPIIKAVYAKLFFVSLYLSFGFVLWYLNKRGRLIAPGITRVSSADVATLLGIGFIGGIVSSIIGSGIDILMFSALTLRYHIGEDVGTPTSVILMAIISIAGTLLHAVVLKDLEPEVVAYFAASVPIVIIGAPFGAWYIRGKSRYFIARLLYIILVVQYISAMLTIRPNLHQMFFSFATICVGLITFGLLAQTGPSRRTGSVPGQHANYDAPALIPEKRRVKPIRTSRIP